MPTLTSERDIAGLIGVKLRAEGDEENQRIKATADREVAVIKADAGLTHSRFVMTVVQEMQVDVHIGVPRPQSVDKAEVLKVMPYGKGTVTVVEGGLEIPNDAGGATLIANACAIVSLEID